MSVAVITLSKVRGVKAVIVPTGHVGGVDSDIDTPVPRRVEVLSQIHIFEGRETPHVPLLKQPSVPGLGAVTHA